MKLKKDANGNVVLSEDGHPIYIHDDGREIPFDAAAATAKIKDLNDENATRRHNENNLMKALEAYKVGDEDGKPVYLDAETAQKAIETVKNLIEHSIIVSSHVLTMA